MDKRIGFPKAQKEACMGCVIKTSKGLKKREFRVFKSFFKIIKSHYKKSINISF